MQSERYPSWYISTGHHQLLTEFFRLICITSVILLDPRGDCQEKNDKTANKLLQKTAIIPTMGGRLKLSPINSFFV